MSNAISFVLRYPMEERAWQTSLAVAKLIDPVTGLLVYRGVTVSAAYVRGGEAVRSPAETISAGSRFAGWRPGSRLCCG